MQRSRLGRWSLAFVAVLMACTPDGEAPQERVIATPHMVNLASVDQAFQAPDTILAGWTTFRFANHGNDVHYAHIVGLESGRTVQELVDAYAEAIRTSGPRPTWVTRFGGPGGVAPGDSATVTQYLEPGQYLWICPVEDRSGHPHFATGEFKSFVVHAADGVVADRAAGPEATMVVRLMDFAFTLDAPAPGRHTIRVENAGVEPHDLVLMRLAPGRTLEDVGAWLNPEGARRADQGGEPPPSLASVGTMAGGIAAIRPGMAAYFEAEFTPGEYVLICMATAPDGRSHIEHGMIQQISVR